MVMTARVLFQPVGNMVLVENLGRPKEDSGPQLALPAGAEASVMGWTRGRVLRLGTGGYLDSGGTIPFPCAEGDVIAYAQGHPIRFKGGRYELVDAGTILGVLNK